jgi:sulfite reductase (NADPH) flavoprotein alpha-component
MIGEGRLKQLHQLLEGYSHEELVWINGYLSGIVANRNTNGHEARQTAVKKINLVFGTETGNSKRLATQLAFM